VQLSLLFRQTAERVRSNGV